MLKRYSFYKNSRAKTLTPLISCVINDALLEMMLNIDQAMLQFINVMNLLDPLLHFSYILQSIGFRFVLLGGKISGKMNASVLFQKVDCPTRLVSRNICLPLAGR